MNFNFLLPKSIDSKEIVKNINIIKKILKSYFMYIKGIIREAKCMILR